MTKKAETSTRILDCAVALMSKKGYNPVSIREIATAANCSEMTIFRHFPSKYEMLAAALRRTSYAEMINTLFTTEIRGDIRYDLHMIMEKYFIVAEQRREILQVYFSALSQINESNVKLNSDAIILQDNLKKYFEHMLQCGKIRKIDPTYAAATFWHLILGYFVSRILLKSNNFAVDREIYITNAVSIVINGMIKE
ncbi:MAG: TetR/AcrR family transcriptional regulator [Desulfovibrionaceae bacterium]